MKTQPKPASAKLPKTKPKKPGAVGARLVRGIDINHLWVDMDRNYFVLPADAASVEAMVETVARALAPLAFHEYKEGECLPRGHEMDTVARVNEMQEWRRRSAYSDARKVLASLSTAKGGPQMKVKKDRFAEGWFACLAVQCSLVGMANTHEKELWAAGGHGAGANPADLETLARYGLTAKGAKK